MFSLLTLLICGLVTTAVIWMMLNRGRSGFSKNNEAKKSSSASFPTSGSQVSGADEARKLDSTIDRVVNKLEAMIPLSEASLKESELSSLKVKLEEKVQWMSQLDAKVAELQADVNHANEQQLALKRASTERTDFAKNIRADRERLEKELSESKAELERCQQQLISLGQEVALDEGQIESVENISSSISEVQQRLDSLEQVYRTTAERFLGMESQFAELEREYERLKDKSNENLADGEGEL